MDEKIQKINTGNKTKKRIQKIVNEFIKIRNTQQIRGRPIDRINGRNRLLEL